MLAHKAEEEGIAAVERMAGQPGHVAYECVPNVVYTWPELASVGITEDEAKEQAARSRSGRFRSWPTGAQKRWRSARVRSRSSPTPRPIDPGCAHLRPARE
jgi:dihydrolipoamide dehydrogenase